MGKTFSKQTKNALSAILCGIFQHIALLTNMHNNNISSSTGMAVGSDILVFKINIVLVFI